MDPVLIFERVTKTYSSPGGAARTVLDAVSFTLHAGETVAVMGRSGSGKSTLLQLAGGVDVPTSGVIQVQGRDLGRLSEKERTLFRRNGVGLVFQFFHLLPHLSVEENVALPDLIAGESARVWRPRARALLSRVGLADRAPDAVHILSGGEMQRVALCRALLRRPPLLLADEPTGNLDDDNSRLVMDLLFRLAKEDNTALLFVTHSPELAASADRILSLHSGRLQST
jgi:putative ABC transport system ATP-binding protein